MFAGRRYSLDPPGSGFLNLELHSAWNFPANRIVPQSVGSSLADRPVVLSKESQE